MKTSVAGLRHLPNLITAARLALTPFIIRAVVAGDHWTALALFTTAAFTDYLDGAAARALGVASRVGAYFDPIADKCLLSGVFIALAAGGIVPVWLVGIILGRDLFILAGTAVVLLFTTVRGFPPTRWGKLSTFVQIVTAVAWMLRDAIRTPVLETAASIMLWPCVGFTVWSGLDYARRGIHIARMH